MAGPDPGTPGTSPDADASPELRHSLHELAGIQERRAELVAQRDQLRRRRRQLEKEMPARWTVATVTERYKGPLGKVELRDETALVDEYVFLEQDLSPAQRPVYERVRTGHEHARDRRLWSYVLRGERTFARRFVRPQERFVTAMLGRQEAGIDALRRRIRRARRRGGLVALAVMLALGPLVFVMRLLHRIQSVVFLNVVKGQATLTQGAVSMPLTVRGGFEVSREELRSAEGRRMLRLSILNERFLTPERRKVLLFMAATFMFTGYLLAEFVVRLAVPELLAAKRQTDLVFFFGISTRLFLPVPFEPILINAAQVMGLWWTVLVAAAGAAVGSWLIFLAGSTANTGLKKVGKRFPWLGRTLTWFETKGRMVAYLVLGVLLSIPFSPDSLTIVGAMLGLRMGPFVLVIFLSAIVRSYVFLVVFGGL